MAWAAETIELFARVLRSRATYADSERYVRPHNFITLLSDSVRLYADNWVAVAGIYFVPALALAILDNWIGYASTGIWPILYLVLSILLVGPLTVAVSEACLGAPPRVRRTYRRVYGKVFLRLMGAVVLQLALMFSGLVAIVVLIEEVGLFRGVSFVVLAISMFGPMIVFGSWYMFIQPAIVLDQCEIFKSFRRSRFLGRGYLLRNLIYALTIGILLLLVAWLGRVLLDQVPRLQSAPYWLTEATEVGISSLPGLILTPIGGIALVLLYYDLRVRKEGFGLEQLEQELHD